MLQVGEVAPDFELLDEEGKPTRLSSFRGRNVVIVFFPAAFSPICTQELKQIGARRMEYERENAAVIGISVDNRWSLRAFKRDEGLSATLLSDFHPKGNVAQKFGVFLGETGYAKRGTFVVDKDGVIRGISVTLQIVINRVHTQTMTRMISNVCIGARPRAKWPRLRPGAAPRVRTASRGIAG